MVKSSPKVHRRTRDDPEVRREQIVDEAIRVIGQRGYHGFTVQELAERCGLTNGGVLYHFGSKEQLLVAVLEARDRREAEIVPASVEFTSQKSGRNDLSLRAVLQVLRVIVARSVTQPELVRLYSVLQSEALDQAHPAHDYFLRRQAMVLDEFTKMVAPHVSNPRATARQIHALADGLSLQWLREKQAFDMVAEWDRAIAMLLPARRRPRRRKEITVAATGITGPRAPVDR
jgi:AcrR family transcriptional regulator